MSDAGSKSRAGGAPPVPPRPLSDEDARPDPERVVVPWTALWIALVFAIGVSLFVGFSPYRHVHSVAQLAVDVIARRIVVYHIAAPVSAALLWALGVLVADRAARSWSRRWRWALGLGIAGVVPVIGIARIVDVRMSGLPIAHSLGWEAAWGALGGAALGWCLGRVCESGRGVWWKLPLVVVAWGLGLLAARHVIRFGLLYPWPATEGMILGLDASWGMLGELKWFALHIAVVAAIAWRLSVALPEPLETGEPRESMLTRLRAGKRGRLVGALACVAVALLGAFALKVVRETALRRATGKGDIETVRGLLDSGVDPSAANPTEGHTALHYAAWYGSTEMVELLLERGAHPNARTRPWGATPLYLAVPRPDVVELLLERGADPNQTLRKGGRDEAGVVNRMGRLYYWYYMQQSYEVAGDTPLHRAARWESGFDCVRPLLEHGADPNAQNADGRTPLHVGAASPHDSTVQMQRLLDGGADPSIRNAAGDTPLDIVDRSRRINHPSVDLLRESMKDDAPEQAD